MQCKEASDANNALFKEGYDKALYKNASEIECCRLTSVFIYPMKVSDTSYFYVKDLQGIGWISVVAFWCAKLII